MKAFYRMFGLGSLCDRVKQKNQPKLVLKNHKEYPGSE